MHPKAIVAVDLLGQPAEYIKIRKIADKYDNVRIGMNSRLDTMQVALKEHGIPNMVYYLKAMYEQGAFRDTPCVVTDLSVTTELCKHVLALLMHPYLDEAEQRGVIEAVKGYVGT